MCHITTIFLSLLCFKHSLKVSKKTLVFKGDRLQKLLRETAVCSFHIQNSRGARR